VGTAPVTSTSPGVSDPAPVSVSPAVSEPVSAADAHADDAVATAPAELASHLGLAVARVNRRARQEGLTTGDDLTASRLAALATIEKHGPITLGEVAALEQVQPPSMTRIVARLEEHGLVMREVDPADRRVARVRITPAGTDVLAVTRTRRNAFLARRVARFTDDERATLAAAVPLLERILDD
jgi:DNA-binding MarR family transcriptional regulator